MEWAIEARGLRKSFGEREAVRGVDLAVHSGELFALLGPNGAGKTTTIRMLTTNCWICSVCPKRAGERSEPIEHSM